MGEQTCKDCHGRGFTVEYPLGFFGGGSPSTCPTCDGTGTINRTGPYRLADGTWSDGIDRSKRIRARIVSDRYEVTTGRFWSAVWHGDASVKYFDEFAEAIRYADHHARTTKNGDNK